MTRFRPQRRRRAAAATVVVAMLVTSCGLPGDGSVKEVDDDVVPYRLLESGTPSSSTVDHGQLPKSVPVVVWLTDDDRLAPEAADASCAEHPEIVVERLLEQLADGPSDEARAAGRSTAIPPESTLALSDLTEGTAELEVDPETAISADRLPAALGQIVLTVTSAPGVRSVQLVSDAVPVSVPLPGGALTNGPVTAADYAALVPDRYRDDTRIGCADP